MSNTIYHTSYIYQIIDMKHPDECEFYFGSRKSKAIDVNEDEYLGSPSSKRTMEFQSRLKSTPGDFVKVILATFNTREEAYKAEAILHNLLDVKHNPLCYNQANQTINGFNITKTYGKNNPSWKGYRHTPLGKFTSAEEMSNTLPITISESYLNRLCSREIGKITQQQYTSSEVLQYIGKQCIGKTPTELGFYKDWITKTTPKSFKPKFITPWGFFGTRIDAVKDTQFTVGAIQRLCKRNVDIHITPKHYRQSKCYKLLGDPINVIGKTPAMLGFNHIHNDIESQSNEIQSYTMYCYKDICKFTLAELNDEFNICDNGSSYPHKIFNSLNRTITLKSYNASKFLQTLGTDVVGKTYGDLSFRTTDSISLIP